MNFISNLKLKYTRLCERWKANRDKKWRKYYLDHYGAYQNADELSHKEMLTIFWKILEYYEYDVSSFSSNTDVHEPGKQSEDWEELGGDSFVIIITRMFGLNREDLVSNRDMVVPTFGELADLVIKKAKEKKLKEGRDNLDKE